MKFATALLLAVGGGGAGAFSPVAQLPRCRGPPAAARRSIDAGVGAAVPSSPLGSLPASPGPIVRSSSPSSSWPPPRRRRRHGGGSSGTNRATTTDLRAASSSSSSSSSSQPPPPAGVVKALTPLLSTALFVIMDVYLRRLFTSLSIAFPSSLAGCGALFATLLTTKAVNSDWGDAVYGLLEPGAGLLATWLPLFFVPSLVTLPLARSVGSGVELAKIATVVVGGFFFTLLTTAWSVMGARALFSSDDDGPAVTTEKHGDGPITEAASPPPPKKAFSKTTLESLSALAVVFGGAAALAFKMSGAVVDSTAGVVVAPLKTACMLSATLATFVFGARLPSGFTKAVHPLVTCTGLTWVSAAVLGAITGGASLMTMLGQYKTGALCPLHACGAGDVLLFMLGPAVVSLACQMYGRRKLMAENLGEVGAAAAVSSVGGLFGTALLVRLLNIADPILRLCMLSRNITSPLAMAIATLVGADVSLAVSIVVITGLIGANFGASILDAVGIRDPVARGLGIGAAAHGLGTAAFKDERDAFPFAAISMALTACTCTVLVSVPAVKAALLKLALG